MGTRAVESGARRWKAVQVGGGFAVLAGVLFALPNLHRLPPPSTALHRADIHAEYVKFPSGRDTITAYLAYPERKDPAPVVVVIHEIFGMSDFIRQTTEQLARDGFVAIAPDLLSRRGGTPASTDDARKLIAGLDPDTVTKDLDATVAYAKRLQAAGASGRLLRFSPAFPAPGSFPASRSSPVLPTTRWAFPPPPATPVPWGAWGGVPENCPPPLSGGASLAPSPGPPPVGSPMMT